MDISLSVVFRIIVDKIDSNKDNTITEEELKKWIQYVQRRYITTDTERMWKDHEPESDGSLLWESYQKRTFGYSDGKFYCRKFFTMRTM